MPSSFCYSELHTRDFSRAKTFYSELFGWKFEDLSVPGMQYATVQGAPGGLIADAETAPQWLAYVSVDDVTQSAERAQKLGAKLVTGKAEVKGMGFYAVLEDPTGARVALWEPLKK